MAGEFPQSMREQTFLTAKTATDPDAVSCCCPGMERSLDVERIGMRMTGRQGVAVAVLLRLLFWLAGPVGNIGIYGYFLEGVRVFQCLLDFKF